VPRYDVPNAAPEPLRLVQQFVNTVDKVHDREWLATPEELTDWFAERGLAVEQASVGDVRRARELRESLRALLRANNGGSIDDGSVAAFNREVRAARVSPVLVADRSVRLAPARSGVDGALGHVLAVALEAMIAGDWRRLKVCRHCSWAFYDYSKNRSGSWCSMLLCGNRSKTRAYRRRRSEVRRG
jgi:predicted RNA-binding Zn ribbon-like protein